MFRQLFLPHLALLLLTLLAVILFATDLLRRNQLQQKEMRLESQAAMLRELWSASPDPLRLKNLGGASGSRLTVIDKDGKVLGDSHADRNAMENHNQRPEVLEARRVGKGTNVRYSDTVHYDMMYVAMVEPGSGRVFRAAVDLQRIDDEMAALYGRLFMAFGLTGLLAAAVAGFLAHWITTPLRKIRSVAQAIAAGDFTQKAPLGSTNEIGNVASAINRMSDELSAKLTSLQAESSKLEGVISSMEDGVIAVDRSGVVEHCNQLARRLFDISVEPKGLRLGEVVRNKPLEEMMEHVLQGGEVKRGVVKIGSRDLSVGVSPLRGAQGVVVVASDVTEARRYDEMRKEFVANVSHELRTPLALIQGYVDTLREGAWQDSDRAQEFLETIQRNIVRLNSIVGDLLQLSRLESGGQIIRPVPIRCATLFDKLRETFEPFAIKKRQSLVVSAPRDVDSFVADPDMIERALSNLIENAIKYTPEGGRVRASVSRREGLLQFVVEDSGIGIPEAEQARVFERFYRVDKSRSRESGGTGLGLAIVKHIAQLHAGSVSVQSQPGKGSAFVLQIPG